MKSKFLAAMLLLLFVTPARSEDCLAMMFKIDKALETAKVSKEIKDKAQDLRDQGESLANTGENCEPPLLEALRLLGQ